MGKIRIAFVVWTFEGMGGSEHVVFDIVRKLDRNKFEISVLSLKDGPIRNVYETLGVKVRVFAKERKYDFKSITAFRNHLVEEHIDILNAHHLSPFYCSFLATRRTGVKIVFTEHSVWQLEKLSLARKILNKMVFRQVHGFVAISEQIRNYYMGELKLPRHKIHLITNGVDLNRFRKTNADYKKMELGFRSEDKIIGTVAIIRREKNHRMLLSAFSRLADEMKNVHLLLVGLDLMNGEVQSIARESKVADRIHFLGQREDVPEILNILDIFCLSSFYEGLPISLLEAMASEVAVIGSDVLGINEVIKHKENGLLFPIGDEEMLLNHLRSLLADEEMRKTMGRKGRVYVEENYNLEGRIEKYDALFQYLKEDGSQSDRTITESLQKVNVIR